MAITPRQWDKYFALRKEGFSKRRSAMEAGFSYQSAIAKENGLKDSSGKSWLASKDPGRKLLDPVEVQDLKPEAKRALDDIAYFALRYFGLILMPWQIEATEEIVRLQQTEHEEYVVINVAPGTGKSTFFTLVLPAWVTVRDRTIRGMVGSAAANTAGWYTGRLRTAFTRTQPVKAKLRDIQLGIAQDAEATLAEDFGRFKPDKGDDIWRVDSFAVCQLGGVEVSEKESTWQAFGRTSTFLGARVDLCIWDDVYDPSQNRTADAREQLKVWWSEIAETRLEPGGLLILQGQRISSDDIYRYALDQKGDIADDEAEDDDPEDDSETSPKYHHIVFKAHYEDRCQGRKNHRLDSPPYPEGCLLYPRRLPWKKLRQIRTNSQAKFQVLYQQEDVDPDSVLIPKLWIYGGKGADGVDYMGCLDNDRDLCELPRDSEGNIALSGDLVSVCAADPSPSKYWSLQWWIYHPDSEQHFLMDLERRVMDAPDFLDFNQNTKEYYGLMHEWQLRSIDLGLPITHWIVEVNAAQKFMLQYDHMRKWRTKMGVNVVPHYTARNKSDEKMGIGALKPLYSTGRARIPWKNNRNESNVRMKMLKIIDELTQYPEGSTDDCVMANWMYLWNLPNIYAPRPATSHKITRPTWLLRRVA